MNKIIGFLAALVTFNLSYAQVTPKPSFHILFSNDCTNITSLNSPYYKRNNSLTDQAIQGSVDETVNAGIDVHMLQPGFGWVPFWQSKVYPLKQHFDWITEKTNLPLNPMAQYLYDGGDIVKVFTERCRQKNITPFISLRMNDYHQKNHVHILKDMMKNCTPAPYNMSTWTTLCISRFYMENMERYRLGPDPKEIEQDPLAHRKNTGIRFRMDCNRVFNWAIPQVREQKFAFLKELCENYDFDGLELDFMRHSHLFRQDETTSSQRKQIMTDFVQRVRNLLDHTAKPGQHRYLAMRIPNRLSVYDNLGIDLPSLVDIGLEIVNLSCHYHFIQQTDLSKICQLVPNAAVYLELTYTTRRYSSKQTPNKKARNIFRFTTDEQFYTAAHLAYSRGAAGVSVFNFHYYRDDFEPPFHIFKNIKDPDWLARQKQHYFLTRPDAMPSWPADTEFPTNNLKPDSPLNYVMDMAPPTNGWTANGRLRIQSSKFLGSAELAVWFNNQKLKPTDDTSEPYSSPYTDGLGDANTLRAWIVPSEIVKNGMNNIRVEMCKGKPLKIVFIDLAIK